MVKRGCHRKGSLLDEKERIERGRDRLRRGRLDGIKYSWSME